MQFGSTELLGGAICSSVDSTHPLSGGAPKAKNKPSVIRTVILEEMIM